MDIISFLLYCIIVTFTPGPTNIVILSTSHNLGVKKALEFSYGAAVAFGILLGISATLNSVIVAATPRILIVMQAIGSFYMLYLAYQIYKMDVSEAGKIETATFLSGFLMQFVNPKVIMFTLTVFPAYILPYFSGLITLSIFVLVITAIGFCAFITWVLFGVVFKVFLQKYIKIVNIIMGIFLVYSAITISGVVELIKG